MQAPVLRVIKEFPKLLRRNFGITAPAMQTDPIQKLFVDKIREYRSKSKGGTLLDPSPEMLKEIQGEKERIEKQFQTKGEDMTKFPSLKFTDPELAPINLPEN